MRIIKGLIMKFIKILVKELINIKLLKNMIDNILITLSVKNLNNFLFYFFINILNISII